MKSCSRRIRKSIGNLLKITLAALLLFAFVGCSNGASQMEVEAEIEKLTAENERLRAELDEANANLITAEERVDELEEELKAMNEAPTIHSPSVPATVDITPPEHTPRELLIGQWFYQGFHEEGEFSFTQTLVFNADGTGSMSRRYYIPKSEIEKLKSSTVADFDSSVKASWRLDGDTVHITLDNGETADFAYSSTKQLLEIKNGNDKYGKEMPSGMEQYVERALYAEDLKAKEAARMRRFLGMWYFDLTTWTFNEDGTCVVDIPELAGQPASTLEYTYRVSDDSNDGTYLCLMLDSEKGTSYF